MTVDGKTGLLVTIIKNVQQSGILDLAREVTPLNDAAHSGKIDLQDLSGGIITVFSVAAIVALVKVQTQPG